MSTFFFLSFFAFHQDGLSRACYDNSLYSDLPIKDVWEFWLVVSLFAVTGMPTFEPNRVKTSHYGFSTRVAGSDLLFVLHQCEKKSQTETYNCGILATQSNNAALSYAKLIISASLCFSTRVVSTNWLQILGRPIQCQNIMMPGLARTPTRWIR